MYSKTFNSHSTPPPSSFQLHWFRSLMQQSPDRYSRWICIEDHITQVHVGGCHSSYHLLQKLLATSTTFNSHSTPPPSSFQLHWFRSLMQQSPDRVQSLDLHRRLITQVHVGGCHSSYHLLQKLLATSKTFNSHSTPPPSSFQLHWFRSLMQQSPDRYSRWICIEDHKTQVHVGGCHSSYHLLQKLLATSKTFNSHSTPPPSSFQLHWFRSLVQQSPDRVQSLDLHRRLITQVHVGGCHSSYHLLQKLLATSKTFNSHSTPPPSSFQLHWFRSLMQQSPDRYSRWICIEDHKTQVHVGGCHSSYHLLQKLLATSKTFNSHSTPPPSSFQLHWFRSLVQQSPDRVQSLELHRRPYNTGSCRWVPLELPPTSRTNPSKNFQPTPYWLTCLS